MQAGAHHGRHTAHHDALTESDIGRRIVNGDLVAGTDFDVAVKNDVGMKAVGGLFDVDRARYFEA